MENPFIAPDIKDLLAEKKHYLHHFYTVFGSGLGLVLLLLSVYYIGVLAGVIPRFEFQKAEPTTDATAPESQRVPELTEAEKVRIVVGLAATATTTISPTDAKKINQSLGSKQPINTMPTPAEREAIMKALGSAH